MWASPLVEDSVGALPEGTAQALGTAGREGRDLSYQILPNV